MIKHLTREQIDRYRVGTLASAEEDALENHLDACAECRVALGESVRHVDGSLARKLVLPALATFPTFAPEGPQTSRWAVFTAVRRNGGPMLATLALVLVLGTLVLSRGASADTTKRERLTIARQIAAGIARVLNGALPALKASHYVLSADPARYGLFARPDEKKLRNRAELFLQHLNMTPGFARLYYGDKWGTYTAAERQTGIDLRRVMPFEQRVYKVDQQTNRIQWEKEDIRDSRQYDPCKRPWYKAGENGTPLWNLYLFHDTRIYGITASLPLSGPDGEKVGKFGIDIPLKDLSIQELGLLGRSARMFILSGEREIVAQSIRKEGSAPTLEPVLNGRAWNSSDPVQKAMDAYLSIGKFAEEFNTAGCHIEARRIAVEGLPWTVVVAVPNRDLQRGTLFAAIPVMLSACGCALLFATGAWTVKQRRRTGMEPRE